MKIQSCEKFLIFLFLPILSVKDLVLDDINVNDDKDISIVKAYPIGGHMKKVTVEIKNFDYILVFQLVNT